MRREDLGFVVSRALAVWLFVTAVITGTGMLQLSAQGQLPDRGYTYLIYGQALLEFGLAWLLWFKADSFAPPSPKATGPADAAETRSALLGAVGLFYLVKGAIGLGHYLWLISVFRPLGDRFQGDWRESVLTVLVGGAIFGATGRFRPTETSAARKLSDFWHVGDPEEMKDEA